MKRPRLCAECGTRTEFKKITVEPVLAGYEQNGITLQVSDVPAMVCPNCGIKSFPPGVADEVIMAINEMLAAAEKARQWAPDSHWYSLSIGAPTSQLAEEAVAYKANSDN